MNPNNKNLPYQVVGKLARESYDKSFIIKLNLNEKTKKYEA